MLNKMLIQILRQWTKKPSTNPFPVAHVPDSLSEALEAAAEGAIELNPPVDVPEHFRGKIAYDRKACIGCKMCIRVCPANAIEYVEKDKKVIFHMDRCCFCAQCTEICPVKCIWMTGEFAFASYDRKGEVISDSGQKPQPPKNETAPEGASGGSEEPTEKTKTTYEIDPEKCIGCTKCSKVCPVDAVSGKIKEPHVIDENTCVGCGACAENCPVQAIHPKE
ncbi:MAG TPA: 4Fe-4S ferredoxin [Synergistaceae bacterium]|nr:4Fe-4S ferredoxin [Synergistaceae bacterium]